MNLCEYKDIFGKVDTGLHKYKIFGISVVDTLLTLLVSLVIGYFINKKYYKDKLLMVTLVTFVVLFLIGELLHYLFCVDTAFIKFFKN